MVAGKSNFQPYKLRFTVFVIATVFTLYLAKGNLEWIPNWILLAVMGGAGVYWLCNEPSVREVAVYIFQTETSTLIHPSTKEPIEHSKLRLMRAIITVIVVFGVCSVIGIGTWTYRASEAEPYSVAAEAQIPDALPDSVEDTRIWLTTEMAFNSGGGAVWIKSPVSAFIYFRIVNQQATAVVISQLTVEIKTAGDG